MNDKQKKLEEIFGEPISIYTDNDAVEDGCLVAINAKDRVSRACWEWLAQSTPLGSKPPDCWPVELMGWFQAGNISQPEALKRIAKHGTEAQAKFEREVRDKKAKALASGLIGTHGTIARRVYENNEGGGIWAGWAVVRDGTLLAFNESSGSQKLWLIPNEQNGLTLMFPEDY